MSLPRPRTAAGRTALERILTDPSGTVAAFDFDGTLAPIVPDPRDSAAYPGIVDELAGLAPRLRRVAVVTGRPAQVAVSLGGLDRIPDVAVLGHYGGERWEEGRVTAPAPPPGIELVRGELPGLVQRVGAPDGTWIEDKARSLAVHTRRTPDPEAALELLAPELANLARRAGLKLEPGRMVIELRPPGMDKGAALTSLVTGLEADTVLYAGDDLGDLPAFDAVERLRERGLLGLTVCSASEEAAAVAERADLVVPGPAGLYELVRRLRTGVPPTEG